ncbi:YitT family protein [Streptomyces sp. NPDC051561]|uniref:membrane protein YczE n=1 Tax=Streptomyces sp. NPDC051561 TaxID=3365658 RepID=UPI00378F897F
MARTDHSVEPPGPASMGRRMTQLTFGLVLFGISMALMIVAGLGVASWDVLHQGLAHSTGISFGLVVNGIGVLVLLAWIPLRVRPGIGTVLNILVVGLVADATLALLPTAVENLPVRVLLLLAGVALNALATGLYVGAGLGPGPRDGLMTGLAERGISIRVARTGIELTVLAAGWLLGGTVGVGTLLFAMAIGPLTQPALHRFTLTPQATPTSPTPPSSS